MKILLSPAFVGYKSYAIIETKIKQETRLKRDLLFINSWRFVFLFFFLISMDGDIKRST
jgi:hypothetical protein